MRGRIRQGSPACVDARRDRIRPEGPRHGGVRDSGGGIAARAASQSPNDGYTLYLPSTSTFLALPGGPGVAPNMPVELPRDFASIGFVLQQPIFIGASHKSEIGRAHV